MIKVAFYDAKAYDRPSFEHYGELNDIRFRFLETKLNEDTAELARGCDAVCVFVNDTVNAEVIDRLYEYGVKLIALRSAGYADRPAVGGLQQCGRAPCLREDPCGACAGLFTLCRGGACHRTAADLCEADPQGL